MPDQNSIRHFCCFPNGRCLAETNRDIPRSSLDTPVLFLARAWRRWVICKGVRGGFQGDDLADDTLTAGVSKTPEREGRSEEGPAPDEMGGPDDAAVRKEEDGGCGSKDGDGGMTEERK